MLSDLPKLPKNQKMEYNKKLGQWLGQIKRDQDPKSDYQRGYNDALRHKSNEIKLAEVLIEALEPFFKKIGVDDES